MRGGNLFEPLPVGPPPPDNVRRPVAVEERDGVARGRAYRARARDKKLELELECSIRGGGGDSPNCDRPNFPQNSRALKDGPGDAPREARRAECARRVPRAPERRAARARPPATRQLPAHARPRGPTLPRSPRLERKVEKTRRAWAGRAGPCDCACEGGVRIVGNAVRAAFAVRVSASRVRGSRTPRTAEV